jgi:hypothetical protein
MIVQPFVNGPELLTVFGAHTFKGVVSRKFDMLFFGAAG